MPTQRTAPPSLEQARNRLEEMRRRLANSIREMDRTVAEAIQSRGELSNLPTHNADHDTEGIEAEIALEQNEEGILQAVRDALARLEEGTYGQCVQCQKSIASERLEALPYAALCIQCERRRERRQGR